MSRDTAGTGRYSSVPACGGRDRRERRGREAFEMASRLHGGFISPSMPAPGQKWDPFRHVEAKRPSGTPIMVTVTASIRSCSGHTRDASLQLCALGHTLVTVCSTGNRSEGGFEPNMNA
jgi:hypothetical protein